VILENPAVSEACVFGISDEKLGEEICAYIVLKDKDYKIEDL
jgi:non-ribosomal peptide synthetase component E (peptide arylation enzyme)